MRYLTLTLSIGASLLALSAWVTTRYVGTKELTAYDIFPLFGLLAFTLMWAQVVGSGIRRFYGITAKPSKHVTSVISGLILSLIILHPLTLWVALFLDGAGLPPASYLSTYGISGVATVALILGTVALVIFLSYELRRWFSHTSWWRYILPLQSVALLLIFFHALILGKEAGHTWFTLVWIFYGISLAVALFYNHAAKRRR